jgi:hypothetical protein
MLDIISISATYLETSSESPGERPFDTSGPHEMGSSKIPEVTLAFWVIKVAATTLGETGGDALSMTMNFGYALSTAVFFGLFVVTVAAQLAAKSFHPFLYWGVIVATTTAGTTMADFADRSLGIGYVGGSAFAFEPLDGCPGVLAVLDGLRLGQPYRLAQSGSILLGDDPLFEHAGNGSWRLLCRYFRVGVRRGSDRLHWFVSAPRSRLLPHQCFSHLAVLVGVYPDAPAWRNDGRPAHQAVRTRGPQPRPHQFLTGHRDLHRQLHPLHASEGGRASWRARKIMRFGPQCHLVGLWPWITVFRPALSVAGLAWVYDRCITEAFPERKLTGKPRRKLRRAGWDCGVIRIPFPPWIFRDLAKAQVRPAAER